jgi:acylphosphatase
MDYTNKNIVYFDFLIFLLILLRMHTTMKQAKEDEKGETMKQCVKIKVTGKVQGASYRKFVQKHALRLEIEGTIQNLDDEQSTVIHACGSSDQLDELIDLLYTGTPESKVQDVIVEPLISEKNFRGVFRIIGD